MKGTSGWPGEMLRHLAVTRKRVGRWTRQGLVAVLSTLMIMIPIGQGQAFADSGADYGQQSQQPMSADQLDQLVAPIALYPDALVAQVLAAATYPTQVVEADRWLRAEGNAPPQQIAADAENQNWDPSVKALTAFPAVLAQMDRNIQWTTDLGNAYYNQPQDVMDSIQALRQNAEAGGQLQSTPQQVVSNDSGAITIVPANPTVVYVPTYDPWTVYGAPIAVYPGYYYAPAYGSFWGGLAVGFGVATAVGFFSHWGWGWGHWGMGWQNHAIFYNRTNYFTHSTTVINRGFNRPGGPSRNYAARGAYSSHGGFNRPGGTPNAGYRGAVGENRLGNYGRPGGVSGRPSASFSRPAGNYGGLGASRPNYATRGANPRSTGAFNRAGGSSYRSSGVSQPNAGYRGAGGYGGRPGGAINHPSASFNRPPGNNGHFSGGPPRVTMPREPMNRGSFARSGGHSSGGGGHSSGSGHVARGHSSGGHGRHG